MWVDGYNSREQLRDDLGTNLIKHVDLARYGVSLSIRLPPNSAFSSLIRPLVQSSFSCASKLTCVSSPYPFRLFWHRSNQVRRAYHLQPTYDEEIGRVMPLKCGRTHVYWTVHLEGSEIFDV